MEKEFRTPSPPPKESFFFEKTNMYIILRKEKTDIHS